MVDPPFCVTNHSNQHAGKMHDSEKEQNKVFNYSRTSMARTPSGL